MTYDRLVRKSTLRLRVQGGKGAREGLGYSGLGK